MADGPVASTAAARRRALVRAEAGKSLSLGELTALLETRGDELTDLLAIAARQRDLGWGDMVTYSRKVFVPLTMLCRDHCHYCTFAKPPAKLDAPYLTPEEVVAIARHGAKVRLAPNPRPRTEDAYKRRRQGARQGRPINRFKPPPGSGRETVIFVGDPL